MKRKKSTKIHTRFRELVGGRIAVVMVLLAAILFSRPVSVVASQSSDSFSIIGSWKSIGDEGFGQAQPGSTVWFDETHCCFYSPSDTYELYWSGDELILECTNVLWGDTLRFRVTILSSDHIYIDYGSIRTELERVEGQGSGNGTVPTQPEAPDTPGMPSTPETPKPGVPTAPGDGSNAGSDSSRAYTDEWRTYLSDSSYEFNRDLAILLAELSDLTEYSNAKQEIEKKLVKELGFSRGDVYSENYTNVVGFGMTLYPYAYTIASRPLDDGYLLLIVARGSKSVSEFTGDALSAPETDFFGYNSFQVVADFDEEIRKGLEYFLDHHSELESSNLKIVLTGHSLGGAAVNLLSARFDMYADGGAWWSEGADPESIYSYTFGAINSIDPFDDERPVPVKEGYENIHNVYNAYDSFGFNGEKAKLTSLYGINTIDGKFGHVDMFFKRFEEGTFSDTANHNMNHYVEAMKDIDVTIYHDYDVNTLRAAVACPVDVEVLRDGETVAAVKDNEVVSAAEGVTAFVSGDVKYF